MNKDKESKDKLDDIEAQKEKQRPSLSEEDIPKGIRNFLGPDHLHLFKRDDTGFALSQGHAESEPESDEDES